MRFRLLGAVAAAGLWVQPANAVEGLGPTVDLSIQAHVLATRYTFDCGPGTLVCDPTIEDFTFDWTDLLTYPSEAFATGPAYFDLGWPYGAGEYSGRISYLGAGRFEGSNFNYHLDGGMHMCNVPSDCFASDTWGAAPSFRVSAVRGAVPETSTWAMMILGFGAIGVGMRRRIKQIARAQLSYA